MRRMVRLLVATGAVASNLALAASAAAPVTPSYQGVEQKIQAIRQAWASPGASAQPNRAGWDALLDALLADLRDYGKAESANDRLAALDPIYQISEALGTVAWRPAAEVREEVREWLRPRLRLAWATRRLAETVLALPATSDPNVTANRTRWVDFVRTDLGTALREYDSAPTVAKRQSALRKIQESLGNLSAGNRTRPWWPSAELEAAVNDLFNRPNVDIAADVSTVSPLFNAELVQSGPVTRKGYVSQVTAGPKTGFGLMTSDDGIAFYNKQQLTSVTPVWDFQNRVASDAQGQRATKLYQFNATTYDWAELTITTKAARLGAPDRAVVHPRDRGFDHIGADRRARPGPGDRRDGGHERGRDQPEGLRGVDRPVPPADSRGSGSTRHSSELRSRQPRGMPICVPGAWSMIRCPSAIFRSS